MSLTDRLHQLRLLPVIALNRAEQAEPLGQTLLAAGLPAAEITFRTPVAAEAIRRLRAAFPELLIAAGERAPVPLSVGRANRGKPTHVELGAGAIRLYLPPAAGAVAGPGAGRLLARSVSTRPRWEPASCWSPSTETLV